MISQSVSKLGGQLVGLGVEHKDGSFDFNWLDKPIHNKIVSGGLDHMLMYNNDPINPSTSNRYVIQPTLCCDQPHNTDNKPHKGVLYYVSLGTDGSPTSFTDTDLKQPIQIEGNRFSKNWRGIADGGNYWCGSRKPRYGAIENRISHTHVAVEQDTTIRELAWYGGHHINTSDPNIVDEGGAHVLFSRVVLDQPIYLSAGDKLVTTYQLNVQMGPSEIEYLDSFYGVLDSEGNPLKAAKLIYATNVPLNNSYRTKFGGFDSDNDLTFYVYSGKPGTRLAEMAKWSAAYATSNGYSSSSGYQGIYYSTSDVVLKNNLDNTNTELPKAETSTGYAGGEKSFTIQPYTGVGTNDKYRDSIYTMGLYNPGMTNPADYIDIRFMCISGMMYRFGYLEEDGVTWHSQAFRKYANQVVKITNRKRLITEDTVQ
jgi:hypothetical protein